MRFIYTFFLVIVYPFLLLVGLFHQKLRTKLKGYGEQLPTIPSDTPLYWFHCASLGEFDMAMPVMEALKEQLPNCKIFVTFFSPSGMQHVHKRKHVADYLAYLPYDVPWKMHAFIQKIKPVCCFLVKYEFWPNLIYAAKRKKIKLVSICTLLREDQRFFKWWGGLFRNALKGIDQFYVQTEETNLLLQKLGITSCMKSGDTRFDRVIRNKEHGSNNPKIEEFVQGGKAILLGSSWSNDEALFIPYLKALGQKVIIAPHDISENHLLEIKTRLQTDYCCFSNYTGETCTFMILDTIGHLTSAYKYGKWAYVGGGFTGKLHNILEPAVFGLPVLFGPKHQRFPEAQSFIDRGFGFSIGTSTNLAQVIHFIEENQTSLATRAIEYVEENKGASERIIAHYLATHSN